MEKYKAKQQRRNYAHRDSLLREISCKSILDYYSSILLRKSPTLDQDELISNPFVSPYIQHNPTFHLYETKIGSGLLNRWRYTDIATSDHGDFFDFVMKMYKLTFNEAVAKVESDKAKIIRRNKAVWEEMKEQN